MPVATPRFWNWLPCRPHCIRLRCLRLDTLATRWMEISLGCDCRDRRYRSMSSVVVVGVRVDLKITRDELPALRSTTEKTILAIAGAGWLRPTLCSISVFSVPAVSLRDLHPFRLRCCKTHVPVRVGRQNLKGFLDPYAIRP
jgi:hypothetical protein